MSVWSNGSLAFVSGVKKTAKHASLAMPEQSEVTATEHVDLILERLQRIGERFGCPPGKNRFDWIEDRLSVLEAYQRETKGPK